MMMNQSEDQAVCYLCNILDEQTKAKRAFVYDSPAATKKVFDVCHALQSKFNRVYVVTMARGQQRGRRQSFAATVKKTSGLPVLYSQFNSLPLLTYFLSSISLIFIVWRVIKQQKGGALHLIVYNRNWLYVPSLVLARLLKSKCYLDLEDGALVETSGYFGRVNYTLIKSAFDALCCHGSILVTPGLITQVNTPNNVVCYGVAKTSLKVVVNDWQQGVVRFLFGGTLMRETGVLLLMDAVRILNSSFQEYKGVFIILVTGHGPLAEDLAKIAQAEGKGWIEYHGRVEKKEYEKLLSTTHVGLCLKLPSSEMGSTTFPSKVIEIASQGKLVLTTKLGHVNDLLGADGAIYLEDENPLTLAKAIVSVVSDRDSAMRSANIGQLRVLELCSSEKVADDICRLFKGSVKG
jgi:glycosyltransferase involved in cell wall biosynthesis